MARSTYKYRNIKYVKYLDDRWFKHLNSTVSFLVLDRIPLNKLPDINTPAQIPNYVSYLKV